MIGLDALAEQRLMMDFDKRTINVDDATTRARSLDLMENFRKVSLDFRARKVRFQLRKCGTTGVRIGTQMSRISSDSPISGVCGRD